MIIIIKVKGVNPGVISTDYMASVVNDKQTYEVLKRDPTPTLYRKLNKKLLTLKKTKKIDLRRYNSDLMPKLEEQIFPTVAIIFCHRYKRLAGLRIIARASEGLDKR